MLMLTTAIKKQILIVDRDIATAALYQRLTELGFGVRAVADGSAALEALSDEQPHLVILDWNMPGSVALEIIRIVRSSRAAQPTRLIILSALAAEHDVVAGLELGADDYILKPYSMREVAARVAAVLRTHVHQSEERVLSSGALLLDSSTARVSAHGLPVNLRGVEYRLLEFLMTYPGRTFNRTQLLLRIWGADTEVDERTVDVNVQRLRKLLSDSGCESYLQTVRGFGYRFSVPQPTSAPATRTAAGAD